MQIDLNRATFASSTFGTFLSHQWGTAIEPEFLAVRPAQITSTMDQNICAKLVSMDKRDGKKEGGRPSPSGRNVSKISLVLLLEINKPVTIGRNPNLW